jgi:hypothetical protein
MLDEVSWGRTKIRYSYAFKDRKTLAIHVHPDLRVTVDVPNGTSLEAIQEKVKKRAAWIRKSKREFELYLPKQPPRKYIGGESHRYLGRQYRLKIVSGNIESVKCYPGYFTVTCEENSPPEKIKQLLDRWYAEKAKVNFNKAYNECSKKANLLGINPSPPSIRKLKTRWGSCSRSGRIIINIDLIKAPTECIEYVIMHEFCHIREYNHGPKFWKLLEKVMPDYRERKIRLNLCADL